MSLRGPPPYRGGVAELTDPRRLVPRTDAVLADPRLDGAVGRLGRALVKEAVVGRPAGRTVRGAGAGRPGRRRCWTGCRRCRRRCGRCSTRPACCVHTNLGRAPLSVAARARGAGRGRHHRRRARPGHRPARAARGRARWPRWPPRCPTPAAVHVVNNGAAALVLAATALAAGREIVRQPRRAGGDRRRLPAPRPASRPPARGCARSAPPTGPRWPTTRRRSARRPASCSRCTRRTSWSAGSPPRSRSSELADPGRAAGRRHRLRAAGAVAAAAGRAGRGHRAAGRRRAGHRERRQAARRPAGRAAAGPGRRGRAAAPAPAGPGAAGGQADAGRAGGDPARARPCRWPGSSPPTRWRCGRGPSGWPACCGRTGSTRRGATAEAAVGGGGAPGVELPSAAVSLPEAYAAALRAGDPAGAGPGRGRAAACWTCGRSDETDDRALQRAILRRTGLSRARRRDRRARRPRQVHAGPGADRDGAGPLGRGAAARDDHRPRLRLDPAAGRATVAFVDVPGHERFVPNMLAGVGPVPAVLFVVAADEGWMPQSDRAPGRAGRARRPARAARGDPGRPGRPRTGAGGRAGAAGPDVARRRVPAVAVSAATGAGLRRAAGGAGPAARARCRCRPRTRRCGCGWTGRSRSGAAAPW